MGQIHGRAGVKDSEFRGDFIFGAGDAVVQVIARYVKICSEYKYEGVGY